MTTVGTAFGGTTGTKVFPGRLNAENLGAIDWSRGLVAYGCQCYVVVVSPHSMEIVQTLDDHHAPVTAVRWTRQTHTATVAQAELILASADSSGAIVVWNVCDGTILSTLRDVPMPADKIEWHPEKENMLLSLHHAGTTQQAEKSAGLLVLWNTKDSAQLWTCTIGQDFAAGASLAFSPFEPSVVAFSSTSGAVYFVTDFSLSRAPGRIESKYRIGAGTPAPQKKQKQSASPPSFRQLVFSPHVWNVVYFLLTREIIVFDMTLSRAIGSTPLDRNCEPFQSILVCNDNPSLIFCLHEDGSVSSWRRIPDKFEFELTGLTSSQVQRKGQKKIVPSSAALCPVNQTKLATVSLEGFMWVWDFVPEPEEPSAAEQLHQQMLERSVSPRERMMPKKTSRSNRICIVGELETLFPSRCLAVCPAVSTLIATGTESGLVQVIDLDSFGVKRSIQVFPSSPVTSLTWVDQSRILVGSVNAIEAQKGSNLKYTSAIMFVDLPSCTTTELRPARPSSAFVKEVKVSPAKQYCAVTYANVVELWDIASVTMFKNLRLDTFVSTIEWLSSKSFFFKNPQDISEASSGTQAGDSEQLLIALVNDTAPTLIPNPLLTSSTGNMKICTVNRRSAAAVNSLDIDLGVTVTALANKGSFIASGDHTGTLTCWSASNSSSKSYPTHRGAISSLEFSGSGSNVLVAYQSGEFSVWDVSHGTRIATSSYLAQRGLTALSAAWTDENPVILSSDGCLRVLDKSLSQCTSRMRTDSLARPFLPPLVVAPHHSLLIRSLLLNDARPGVPPKHRDALAQYVGRGFLDAMRTRSTLEICTETAVLFESAHEHRFWQLARHAFLKFGPRSEPDDEVAALKRSRSIPVVTAEIEKPVPVAASPESPRGENPAGEPQKATVPVIPAGPKPAREYPLAGFYSNLSTSSLVKAMESEMAVIHTKTFEGSTEIKADLQRQLSGYDILVGRREEAVDLLMMATGAPKIDYTVALKACVIAATISPEVFRNTAKMVAAQLIAQGELQEGVQLLCCIGKASDACKYLISESRWTDAAWLANVALAPAERAYILNSWATFLVGTDLVSKGIEVLLTLGDFHRALALLHRAKSFETAAMFARCCIEQGVLDEKAATTPQESLMSAQQLISAVFTDYGQYLNSMFGLSETAQWYASGAH